MKGKLKRISACLLCAITFGCWLGSCKKEPNEPSTPSENTDSSNAIPVIENEYVVEKGTSDYKIVVSDDAATYVNFAVSEFNTFFKKATSFELEVVTDNGLTFNGNEKYISIGENDVQGKAGVDCGENITSDGFVIKTVDNSVFVVGNTDLGNLYGTYELLRYLIDWECYGIDVYWYETNVAKIPLYDFDVASSPDIAIRTSGHPIISNSTETLMRMNFEPTRSSLAINGSVGHTSMYFVPVDTYYNEHPKWYMDSKQQLCYTAHGDAEEYEALIDACTNTLIASLKSDLTSNWINFSMSDSFAWCSCDACKEHLEKYSVASASVIIFLNDLMESIYEWFETEEAKPYKRDLNVYFYAYQQLEGAPVKYDEKTDTYTPIDDKVICGEHVVPQLCLTVGSYTQDITAKQNQTALNNIKSWAALSERIQAYMYCANYQNYLIPHNTTEALQSWYQTYKKYGCVRMYDHGKNMEGGLQTGWYNLQIYLDSKLGWNVNADVETLINRFFKAAYREGSDIMQTLYNEYKVHNKYNESLDDSYTFTSITSGRNVMNKKYWPKTLLDKWHGYIAEALEEIEPLKMQNEALYNTVYKYIVCERVWINYLRFTYYGNSYFASDLKELKEEIVSDIDLCKIGRESEPKTITAYLDSVNK